MVRTFRRRSALGVLTLALVAACGGDAGTPISSPAPTPTRSESPSPTPTLSPENTKVVNVADNEFVPAQISVAAGTEVVWTDSGVAPHSVTSDDGAFDSHPECTGVDPSKCLGTGQSFRHTFSTAGRFAYHCRVHGGDAGAGMSGVVVVT